MTQWFGHDWGAPICKDAPHVDTPVGKDCGYCAEPILDGEIGFILNNGTWPEHYECHMRQIVGSVGHQMKECGCVGAEDTSEVGMTLRQAAIAAAQCNEQWLTATRVFEHGN